MRNGFSYLLVTLCIVDLLVILSNVVLAVKTINPDNIIIYKLSIFSDGLCHISLTASVILTVGITQERYYAVCTPHAYKARVAKRSQCSIIFNYIIPTLACAILFNIPKLLQLSGFLSAETFSPSSAHVFMMIGITYQVFHPLTTTCILPIFILCILNYRISVGSKRMSLSLQKDISMAKIMMTIVTVFITLSIPRMVLAMYEVATIPRILECYRRNCHYYISSTRWVADSIVRYLVMLNSSTNFLIYCLYGSQFRTTLVSLFKFRQKNLEAS